MDRLRRWLAPLLVGLLVGGMLVTPGWAHFTENTKHLGRHAWHQFIKERVFTRNQANNRFAPLPKSTVVVSPAGTPVQSGNRLRAAVDGLVGDELNRRLAKLEPGTYDLGGQTLELPFFVDLEGSGRGVTTIRCDCSADTNLLAGAGAVILVNRGSEVRSLSVENLGSGQPYRHGIDVSSLPSGFDGLTRVSEVEVSVSGNSTNHSGIFIEVDGQATLRDVRVRVDGGTSTADVRGIQVKGGTLDVDDSQVEVFAASNASNYGIYSENAKTDVSDTSVLSTTSLGSDSLNYGVWNSASEVSYTNVTSRARNGWENYAFHNELSPVGKPAVMRQIHALATGGGDEYYGVRNVNADVIIIDGRVLAQGKDATGLYNESSTGLTGISVSRSSIHASGTDKGIGIANNAFGGANGIMRVDNSEVTATHGWIQNVGPFTSFFGGSLLAGTTAFNSGTVSCAFVWNGANDQFGVTDNVCPDL